MALAGRLILATFLVASALPTALADEAPAASPSPAETPPPADPSVSANESEPTEPGSAEPAPDEETANASALSIILEVLNEAIEPTGLHVNASDDPQSSLPGEAPKPDDVSVSYLVETLEDLVCTFCVEGESSSANPFMLPVPTLPAVPLVPLPSLPPIEIPSAEAAPAYEASPTPDAIEAPQPPSEVVSATVVVTEPSTASIPILVGAMAAGAAITLTLAPAGRRRVARWILYTAPTLLFTRLAPSKLLDHPRRTLLVDHVRLHPGQRLHDVRKALGLPIGAMMHHVRVLSHGGVLRVERFGARRLLFLAGPRVRPVYVSPLQTQILKRLAAEPGLTQRQIGHALGLSERVVSYHVDALARSGLLATQREGHAKRCFAAPSDKLTPSFQSP